MNLIIYYEICSIALFHTDISLSHNTFISLIHLIAGGFLLAVVFDQSKKKIGMTIATIVIAVTGFFILDHIGYSTTANFALFLGAILVLILNIGVFFLLLVTIVMTIVSILPSVGFSSSNLRAEVRSGGPQIFLLAQNVMQHDDEFLQRMGDPLRIEEIIGDLGQIYDKQINTSEFDILAESIKKIYEEMAESLSNVGSLRELFHEIVEAKSYPKLVSSLLQDKIRNIPNKRFFLELRKEITNELSDPKKLAPFIVEKIIFSGSVGLGHWLLKYMFRKMKEHCGDKTNRYASQVILDLENLSVSFKAQDHLLLQEVAQNSNVSEAKALVLMRLGPYTRESTGLWRFVTFSDYIQVPPHINVSK